MTDAKRSSVSLTLLVAHEGSLAAARATDYAAHANEVIEICAGPPLLPANLAPGTRYRHVRSRQSGATHAFNLGVSFAAGEWVVLSFGDEAPAANWLERVRASVTAPDSTCIHLFSSGGADVPLIAVRRVAFAYGAFDESLPTARLAALDWTFRIFPRPAYRMLTDEGVTLHDVAWLKNPARPAPDARLDALLDKARAAGSASLSLAELRATMRTEALAAPGNAYRSSAAYEAKHFWEANSAGYIRWEIYQPDEPEIIALAARAAPRSVLELGCGAGRNARYFAATDRYAGIDLSINLLGRATERQESNSTGLVCGNIVALPFANASFEMVFSDSTVQHVTPEHIGRCVADIVRVSSAYFCFFEYTEEENEKGDWFKQIHMFAHDYRRLFEPHCDLLWRADTALKVHPARKEVFFFRKRQTV